MSLDVFCTNSTLVVPIVNVLVRSGRDVGGGGLWCLRSLLSWRSRFARGNGLAGLKGGCIWFEAWLAWLWADVGSSIALDSQLTPKLTTTGSYALCESAHTTSATSTTAICPATVSVCSLLHRLRYQREGGRCIGS